MSSLIGITASRFKLKQKYTSIFVQEKYTQAIQDAGGLPLIIPLTLTPQQVEALVERLDGVLFSGGGDLAPRLYGRHPNQLSGKILEDRDTLELHLLQRIIAARKPFLGICRGIQMINVALGGSLYIDIQAEMPGAIKHDYYPSEDRDLLSHTVCVEGNSLLGRITGSAEARGNDKAANGLAENSLAVNSLAVNSLAVNSLHHQGICRLGKGLKPVAWAPDGLVEAVELNDYPFGLAVQWHPEWLQEHEPMRALFRSFIQDTERV